VTIDETGENDLVGCINDAICKCGYWFLVFGFWLCRNFFNDAVSNQHVCGHLPRGGDKNAVLDEECSDAKKPSMKRQT